jgi:hypothetical protein
MVARRVAEGRYHDMIAWLHEGELLATDFPGYLGSGVLAPPPNGDEFQIIFRFSDEKTLHAWEFSASRSAWLARGNGLFQQPTEQRVSGIEGWFGNNTAQRPPRWKQAVAIWLAFFPVSLAFNLLEQAIATRQPGAARGGKLPGVQGFLVRETEDDLEFVAIGRWSEHPGAEVAGKVGGEQFAFVQPGNHVVITAFGNAPRDHQGNGRGRHRVSPGKRAQRVAATL